MKAVRRGFCVTCACLALLVAAFPAEAADLFVRASGAPAAVEKTAHHVTSSPAIGGNPDRSTDDNDDDDGGDGDAMRTHCEWVPSPARQLFVARPLLLASLAVLASDYCLRGPPASTPFTF